MLKSFFFFIITFFSSLYLALASSGASIKDDIIPRPEDITVEWTDWLNGIFKFFRESIFNLLALITIGVFLYIWARLVVARWNPEELKKTWTSFIYAIVGIVLVSLSWAIVKLVAWLDF